MDWLKFNIATSELPVLDFDCCCSSFHPESQRQRQRLGPTVAGGHDSQRSIRFLDPNFWHPSGRAGFAIGHYCRMSEAFVKALGAVTWGSYVPNVVIIKEGEILVYPDGMFMMLFEEDSVSLEEAHKILDDVEQEYESEFWPFDFNCLSLK
jgi:hypothetical protein